MPFCTSLKTTIDTRQKQTPSTIARNQLVGKRRIQQGSAISQTMAARNDPKTMAHHLPGQEA